MMTRARVMVLIVVLGSRWTCRGGFLHADPLRLSTQPYGSTRSVLEPPPRLKQTRGAVAMVGEQTLLQSIKQSGVQGAVAKFEL
ncbi:hypothetical protein HDK64DRAFT_50568 [Phyllosticta capitalensis]